MFAQKPSVFAALLASLLATGCGEAAPDTVHDAEIVADDVTIVADDSVADDSVAPEPLDIADPEPDIQTPEPESVPLDTAAEELPQGADAPGEPDITDPPELPIVDEVAEDVTPPDIVEPAGCPVPRPILLVHGINGSSANYDVMAARLIEDGWPAELVHRFDAVDPGWTCNVDNAAAIAEQVTQILADTGFDRVDLIAHSMGTLSTRYFLKKLGGSALVNTYITLGGMNHGLLSPCFAPDFLGVCVWSELCQSGAFVTELNAEPATPGPAMWFSMFGTADATVPNDSSHLEGATNLSFEGVEHSGPNGLLEVPEVYTAILEALDQPCWVE